jgi:hypothetical protein
VEQPDAAICGTDAGFGSVFACGVYHVRYPSRNAAGALAAQSLRCGSAETYHRHSYAGAVNYWKLHERADIKM